jgi:hypothetical protein
VRSSKTASVTVVRAGQASTVSVGTSKTGAGGVGVGGTEACSTVRSSETTSGTVVRAGETSTVGVGTSQAGTMGVGAGEAGTVRVGRWVGGVRVESVRGLTLGRGVGHGAGCQHFSPSKEVGCAIWRVDYGDE